MAKPKYRKWLEPEGLTLVRGWARDGLIDEQIAANMGIAPTTFYDWQRKYPQFSEAIKKGKEVVDFEVENALLKSALGYEYEEEVIVKVRNNEGSEKIEKKTVKKYAAPNVAAAIFWLKNRKPRDWRDKQEVDVAPVGVVITGDDALED